MDLDSKPAISAVRSKRGLGFDSLLVIAVGASAVLPFLLAPLRAQILGPSGRGDFAFFQSSFTTIGVAAALGVRFACYQVGFLGDNRFSISYWKMSLLSIAAALTVIIPMAWVAAVQFSPIVFWSIAFTTLLAPSFVMNQIELASANDTNNRIRIGTASSLPAILEFAVTLVFFLAQRFNLVVGIVTAIFAQVARFATVWAWHFKDRRRAVPTYVQRKPKAEIALLTATFRNAPAAVIPLLSGNLDVLIFGVLSSSDVLGHYVVAKLGFSAMLISAAVLEGRAIAFVRNRGRAVGLGLIGAVSIFLAVLCGLGGWLLTPIVFGLDFVASANAFPVLSAAGALAFVFVCVSAINAQRNSVSCWPGLGILLTLVGGCCLLAALFPSDVVALSYGLLLAQAVGVLIVVSQFFSSGGKN